MTHINLRPELVEAFRSAHRNAAKVRRAVTDATAALKRAEAHQADMTRELQAVTANEVATVGATMNGRGLPGSTIARMASTSPRHVRAKEAADNAKLAVEHLTGKLATARRIAVQVDQVDGAVSDVFATYLMSGAKCLAEAEAFVNGAASALGAGDLTHSAQTIAEADAAAFVLRNRLTAVAGLRSKRGPLQQDAATASAMAGGTSDAREVRRLSLYWSEARSPLLTDPDCDVERVIAEAEAAG